MTQSAEQRDGVGMFGVVWGAAPTPLTVSKAFPILPLKICASKPQNIFWGAS